MKKTNAIRILESFGIKYETAEYNFTEFEIDAINVAKKINAAGNSVFKTLVTRGDKTGINVFCIPADAELNLKKAAIVSGNKKIEMVHVKELLPLTGYIRGGCSPIGMSKNYTTFIEETAQLFDMIFVSAGIRGLQVKISPIDLAKVTGAEFKNIII